MINVNLNNDEPSNVGRINPQFEVDEDGNITWIKALVDYDVSHFYRGKRVTNQEFNELFLKGIYQGNYTADSLAEFLNNKLGTVIDRKSHIKTYSSYAAFPAVGEDNRLYVDKSTQKTYIFNTDTLTYTCVGNEDIDIINGGTDENE